MSDTFLSQAQLEYFFNKYYRSLCQISYSYVKDMDVAKDIVQDFFIKYWEKFNNQDILINFESYAHVAVKNRSLNHIKSEEVKLRHENKAQDVLYEPVLLPEDTPLNGTDQYKIKLLKAIDQLPAGQRTVFMMSAVDGLKYMEIAAQMNISINTVKTHIRKAYHTIRKSCTVSAILLILLAGITLFSKTTVFK
ncbi:RNA polymerase sigma-70 factor, ECF subfamily [Chitinophaga costaii]|uniref:RNA polymerase sigma-70 factor, ECF subfamily n=1 Tax=Chitinophaga costaii TaxID=1335309 RepID=A0A1C4EFA0_9BACT|nr:RNA polymerase sigma-70 factor [Chitinophaga costaii]PUZ23860.1 RNA polymerase sigma-70 factor [Chitinophaga costaii]SCC42283.1 RNA polymerase sigma-70 factor, ECF subfamily [Chitinophaga costaii]